MVAWLSTSWRWLSGILSLRPTLGSSGSILLNHCLRAHLRLEENYNVTACLPSPWGSYEPSKIGSPPSQASWHELVDVYDVDGTTKIGNATAWEAQTSCLWHRTVYVILRLPDERFLLQQRAVWKWRMGGLWDLGLSETVELDEDLWTAANRAVTEELGEHAPRHHLRECCRLSVGGVAQEPSDSLENLWARPPRMERVDAPNAGLPSRSQYSVYSTWRRTA
ncbi:unnamed protein product [Cladocopium goreaui]|uniref:NUDIX domain-containing protein n=1 Tax=Cladocopium goreaui TaxID=2562237 RepID=A0A9P1C3B7_9DINO|nr:unnamed protein product [Cladocopium goreaui]